MVKEHIEYMSIIKYLLLQHHSRLLTKYLVQIRFFKIKLKKFYDIYIVFLSFLLSFFNLEKVF